MLRSKPIGVTIAGLLVAALAATPARAADWQPLGPFAGQPVTALATRPPAVWAATPIGMLRREGSGPWELRAAGLPGEIEPAGLAVEPPETGRAVYLLDRSRGPFRSRDDGRHWLAPRTTFDPATRFTAISTAPRRRGVVYVATEEGVLYLSSDGGESFHPEPVLTAPPELFGPVEITALAAGPDTLYAALAPDGGTPVRILRRPDGALRWTFGGSAGHAPVVDLQVSRADPSTVLLATAGSGVWRSDDGAETFQSASDGLPVPGSSVGAIVLDLATDPTDPRVILAGVDPTGTSEPGCGLYRSTDGGLSWQGACAGLPYGLPVPATVSTGSATAPEAFAGTSAGVYRAGPADSSWTPANDGMPAQTTGLAIAPEAPRRLAAATGGQGLHLSANGGATWEPVSSLPSFRAGPLPLDDAAWTRGEPPSIFVSTVAFEETPDGPTRFGVLRSDDLGSTWVEAAQGLPPGSIHTLVPIQQDPPLLFALGRELARTADGGRSWDLLYGGAPSAVAVDPAAPTILFAATRRRVVFPGRIVRSTDAGASWQEVYRLELGDEVTALAIAPGGLPVVYAAIRRLDETGEHGLLLRATGAVGSWRRVGGGLPAAPIVTLAVDPRAPFTVWAGTAGDGVFRSVDDGATWAPVARGALPGKVDRLRFGPGGAGPFAITPAGIYRFEPAPEPPEGSWVTAPTLSGFRVAARISPGGFGAQILGVHEPRCPRETLCFSGALPGRPEILVRVTGPRPNGHLWVSIARFTPSRVEVWVERLATGERRGYDLAGAAPGSEHLPGLLDRTAFSPLPH